MRTEDQITDDVASALSQPVMDQLMYFVKSGKRGRAITLLVNQQVVSRDEANVFVNYAEKTLGLKPFDGSPSNEVVTSWLSDVRLGKPSKGKNLVHSDLLTLTTNLQDESVKTVLAKMGARLEEIKEAVKLYEVLLWRANRAIDLGEELPQIEDLDHVFDFR